VNLAEEEVSTQSVNVVAGQSHRT